VTTSVGGGGKGYLERVKRRVSLMNRAEMWSKDPQRTESPRRSSLSGRERSLRGDIERSGTTRRKEDSKPNVN